MKMPVAGIRGRLMRKHIPKREKRPEKGSSPNSGEKWAQELTSQVKPWELGYLVPTARNPYRGVILGLHAKTFGHVLEGGLKSKLPK